MSADLQSRGFSQNKSSDSRSDSRGGSFGARRGNMSRRKKTCPFTGPNASVIDYKDVKLLQRFLTERGKIIPSRISAVSRKHQGKLAQAVKRARFLALLPYLLK
jgi:small subunit ribosomal protein S18